MSRFHGLQHALRTRVLGRSAEHLVETSSTMDVAFAAATAGAADGHLATAELQTEGRGSHGRRWLSPSDSQLTFSFVWRATLPTAERPALTLAVGLGVAVSLSARIGEDLTVKWPNDVLARGRKLAGILVESRGDGPMVVGVGINLTPDARVREVGGISLAELAEFAESSAAESSAAVDVLASVLLGIEQHLDLHMSAGASATAAALDQRLAFRGEEVTCGDVRGTLVGVAPSGALLIRSGDELRSVISGRLERVG